MPTNNQSNQTLTKRQTAVKIDISNLQSGKFIESNDWIPSFVNTIFGKVSRVNIIGIVISKTKDNSNFIIDDGTGILTVMCNFSNITNFDNVENGIPIKIIGRPRFFNNEIYVVPEIIKPIENMTWIKIRELEIKHQRTNNFQIKTEIPEFDDMLKEAEEKDPSVNLNNNQNNNNTNDNHNNSTTTKETSTDSIDNNDSNDIEDLEEIKPVEPEKPLSINESAMEELNITQEDLEKEEFNDSYELIYDIIKEKDTGDGVAIEDLVEELKNKNFEQPDQLVQKLIEHGEIFPFKPGRMKLV